MHRGMTLIQQLLAIPTMSFHEEGIAAFVHWYALGIGLSVRRDRFGNVLVYHGARPSGVIFNAHMDHPGFEVVSSHRRAARVALWGKVDPRICQGARAVIHTATGSHRVRIGKRLQSYTAEGRPIFEVSSKHTFEQGDFGHFDLPAINMRGNLVYTRAADNLMSVAAILDFFTRLIETRFNAVGLFTRGEEAGFLGAFGAMDGAFIPKHMPLIVLECSSASHACVDIGAGPVIRVGDWQSSYDPTIDCWIRETADTLAKKKSGFAYQRQLLPGGRCEACVYTAAGYRTGGIALPLGNYHNQGKRGPAPEFVSIADYERMVLLMMELARAPIPGKNYMMKSVEPIRKNYRRLQRKLIASA